MISLSMTFLFISFYFCFGAGGWGGIEHYGSLWISISPILILISLVLAQKHPCNWTNCSLTWCSYTSNYISRKYIITFRPMFSPTYISSCFIYTASKDSNNATLQINDGHKKKSTLERNWFWFHRLFPLFVKILPKGMWEDNSLGNTGFQKYMNFLYINVFVMIATCQKLFTISGSQAILYHPIIKHCPSLSFSNKSGSLLLAFAAPLNVTSYCSHMSLCLIICLYTFLKIRWHFS